MRKLSILIIVSTLSVILFTNCNNTEIKKENLVGIWRGDKMINPHEEEEYNQKKKMIDTMTFSDPWDKEYWGTNDPKEIRKMIFEEFENERKAIREKLQNSTKHYLDNGKLVLTLNGQIIDTVNWEITNENKLVEIGKGYNDTLNIDKLNQSTLIISKVLSGKKAQLIYKKDN